MIVKNVFRCDVSPSLRLITSLGGTTKKVKVRDSVKPNLVVNYVNIDQLNLTNAKVQHCQYDTCHLAKRQIKCLPAITSYPIHA